MLIRIVFVSVFLYCFSHTAKAVKFPLEITQITSYNKITELNGQKLILLDFWATWCGPCRPATKQLEILQEQLRDDVYMISVTDEALTPVNDYLKKNPPKLMIVRDEQGNTIKEFNINRRPYAVLLTTSGELVWSGHPANLTYEKAMGFVRKVRKSGEYSINNILIEKSVPKESMPNTNGKLSPVQLQVKRILPNTESRYIRTSNAISYQGSLFNLIAQIYNVPRHLVSSKIINDFNVHMQSPTEIWDMRPDSILNSLSTSLNIRIIPKVEIEKAYLLKVVDKSKLWDDEQIDWGNDNISNHLIGDERIQANDITIADLCVLLSDIKKQNYRYFGDDFALRDWDIHTHYDNLMQDELSSQFGIEIEEIKLETTKFLIE